VALALMDTHGNKGEMATPKSVAPVTLTAVKSESSW
jgi:hypothetical protein